MIVTQLLNFNNYLCVSAILGLPCTYILLSIFCFLVNAMLQLYASCWFAAVAMAEAVKVIVRCRPMNTREKDLKCGLVKSPSISSTASRYIECIFWCHILDDSK